MENEEKNQGVAAQFTGLDVKESIKLKTEILNAAKQIKQDQQKSDGKTSIQGGAYAGPSQNIIDGSYKQGAIENKSGN